MNEMDEIRITVEEAETVIDLKNKVAKLVEIPLFTEVVGKRYFEQESVRLVALMADDELGDDVKLKFQKMMYGIAYFQQWLRFKILEGEEMEQYLIDAKEEMDRTDTEVN